MNTKIFQHYYTSTHYGVDGRTGFQCKAMSPDMPPKYKKVIESYISYRSPHSSSSTSPPSLRYNVIDQDFSLLSYITFTNKIEGELRGGNSFAHTLLLPLDLASRIPPISLIHGSIWKDSCEREITELGTLLEAQIIPSFSWEETLVWLQKPFHQEITLALLTNFFSNKKKPCLLFAETSDTEHLLAAVTYYLPPTLRSRLTFSTYDHDIERGFDITRLLDEPRSYFSSRKSDLLIDLYNSKHNFSSPFSTYADLVRYYILQERHTAIHAFYDLASSFPNFDWFADLNSLSTFEFASKGLLEPTKLTPSFFSWLCQQDALIRSSEHSFFKLLESYPHLLDSNDSIRTLSSALGTLASKSPDLAERCLLWFALRLLQQLQRGERTWLDLLLSQPNLFLRGELCRLLLSSVSSDLQHTPVLRPPFWDAIERQPRLSWLFYRYLTSDGFAPGIVAKILETLLRQGQDVHKISELLELHEHQIPHVLSCLSQEPFPSELKSRSVSFYLSLVGSYLTQKRGIYRTILEPSYGLSFLLSQEAPHDFSPRLSLPLLQATLLAWRELLPALDTQTTKSVISAVQNSIQAFSSANQDSVLPWMEQNGFSAFVGFDFILHKLGASKAHSWLAEKLFHQQDEQWNTFFSSFFRYLQKADPGTTSALFQTIFHPSHPHFPHDFSLHLRKILEAFHQKDDVLFWPCFSSFLSSLCEPTFYPFIASLWDYFFPYLSSSEPPKQMHAHRFLLCFFFSLSEPNRRNFRTLSSFFETECRSRPWFSLLRPFLKERESRGFFARIFGR